MKIIWRLIVPGSFWERTCNTLLSSHWPQLCQGQGWPRIGLVKLVTRLARSRTRLVKVRARMQELDNNVTLNFMNTFQFVLTLQFLLNCFPTLWNHKENMFGLLWRCWFPLHYHCHCLHWPQLLFYNQTFK